MIPDTPIAQFDPADTESALDVVVRAVANHSGTDPNELPPIGDYVDGDAILRLFGGPGTSAASLAEGSLSFRYGDAFVRMTPDGWIVVSDRTGADAWSVTDGLPASRRGGAPSHGSAENALDIAAAAIAEAEEHIWAVASDSPNDEVVDPLWAAVERLWTVQTTLDDVSSVDAPQSDPSK